MLLSIVLLGFMLIIMLMRVTVPFGSKAKGRRLKEVTLSFKERLLLQRTNIYSIGFVLLLTSAMGGLSYTWELLTVLGAFAILFIPVRYIITTEGVGLNNVVFRPWDEFSGIEATSRRVKLVPNPGMRPFQLTLLGAHQKEAEATLRKLVTRHQPRKEDYVRPTPRRAS